MYFMPFSMPNQQQGGSSMSMKDMKRMYKAIMQAQRELDMNKPPGGGGDKKTDHQNQSKISKGELIAYMWVLSPAIGLMTINLYFYCFTQMKQTLQAFGAH